MVSAARIPHKISMANCVCLKPIHIPPVLHPSRDFLLHMHEMIVGSKQAAEHWSFAQLAALCPSQQLA